MRIACIIMAHKEPHQIERFINKFRQLPFEFYIHLDKKIKKESFEYLAQAPNVHFIRNRVRIRWASSSFIDGLLNSFREVRETGKTYDFISVMSGQDYPIKPITNLYNSLEKNSGRNFICFEEGGDWWHEAMHRIHKYHFTNFGFKGRYRIQFFLNALLPQRKFPLPYKLYGGPRAMCMTLTMDCAAYILKFIESNKKLRRFIRFTWGPDEFLIPTLIMNSEFKQTVINDNFYYIDWSRGGPNPKTLTSEDYNMLVTSDKMLARKFDLAKDAAIFDLLDKA
jgi:hypothetical protein